MLAADALGLSPIPIKRCFDPHSPLWRTLNNVFFVYCPLFGKNFESRIRILRLHRLTDAQILFLFHPQSMLWSHPKMTQRTRFRMQLSLDKKRLVHELVGHYRWHICAWFKANRDLMVLLVERPGHSRTPHTYSRQQLT